MKLLSAISIRWALPAIALLSGGCSVPLEYTQEFAHCTDYTYFANHGKPEIYRYTGPGGHVTIPAAIDGMPVTTIGSGAFSNCTAVTGVTIPSTVTGIGDGAFFGCGLTSVTIPDSVTRIGRHAFTGSSLTGITIPGSLTALGDWAFFVCPALTSVTISSGLTTIGDGTFCACNHLSSITIPGSITSIGDRAFSSCTSLRSITVPGSVTSIGYWAFDDCNSLTTVTIPAGVTSMGKAVFIRCPALKGIYFQGDAPKLDWRFYELFVGSDAVRIAENATVYYLPGTRGWGATFGGRPTAQWRPAGPKPPDN
jgi:hypothetical protein